MKILFSGYIFLSSLLFLQLQTTIMGFTYWLTCPSFLAFRLMLLWCMTLCTWCLWASNSFPRWQSVPYSVIGTSPGASGPALWAWLKRYVRRCASPLCLLSSSWKHWDYCSFLNRRPFTFIFSIKLVSFHTSKFHIFT